MKTYTNSLKTKKVVFAKKILLILFVVLILTSLFTPDRVFKLMLFYLAIASVGMFYMWVTIKAVENSCMLKYVKPQQLTEGDWIAKDIKIGGKYITGPKDLGIEKSKIRIPIEL